MRTQHDTGNRKLESSKFMWKQRVKQYNGACGWEPTVGRRFAGKRSSPLPSREGDAVGHNKAPDGWQLLPLLHRQSVNLAMIGTAFCLAGDT